MATFSKRRGPNGRWVWQVRVRKRGYPQRIRTFSLKANADAWARQIEHGVEQGTLVSCAEAENTTLAEVLHRYLIEVTPGKKGRAQEESVIRRMLRDPIAPLSLAAIDGATVAKYRDRRLQVVGPKTVRNNRVYPSFPTNLPSISG